MTAFVCFACHGLAIGYPIDDLAAYLNANTPAGIHFNIVGGEDPQPQAQDIINQLIAAAGNKESVIFIGHSMGAMLSFYAADALAAQNIRSPLFVSIDPTDWGTNAPGIPQWSVVVPPPNTGKWFVPSNVATWLHFNQDTYPGGGVASLAPGNKTTVFRSQHLPEENHLSIVNCDTVRKAILAAVLAVAQS